MRGYGNSQNFDLGDILNQINHWANKFEDEFIPKQKENIHYTAFKPLMDVYEQDNSYIIEIELPGINKSDVNIKVNEDGVLSINGKKTNSYNTDLSKLRQERKFGEFSRSLQLSNDIDIHNISSVFENGILRLKINKKEPDVPKVVEIKID